MSSARGSVWEAAAAVVLHAAVVLVGLRLAWGLAGGLLAVFRGADPAEYVWPGVWVFYLGLAMALPVADNVMRALGYALIVGFWAVWVATVVVAIFFGMRAGRRLPLKLGILRRSMAE